MPQHLRRVLGAGLTAALLAGLTISTAAAAATPITFTAAYGDSCVNVSGPVGSTGSLRLLNSSGAQLDSQAVDLAGDGEDLDCFEIDPLPGMKVSATLDGTTRTWTLPKLSVRIDRATDVVRGQAPAGKTVRLRVRHYSGFNSFGYWNTTKTASSAGTYSKDLTSLVNIRGGDTVSATYISSAGDRISVQEVAPRIQVWIGRSRFGAELLTGTGGKVTLRNAAGTYRATGVVSYIPLYEEGVLDYSQFLNDGDPRTVRAGDKVSSTIQSDMSFTVPTITVAADAASDGVTGTCPAGKQLRLRVAHEGSQQFEATGTCTGAGTFAFDTTGFYDIVAGDRAEIAFRFVKGDLVARRVIAQ